MAVDYTQLMSEVFQHCWFPGHLLADSLTQCGGAAGPAASPMCSSYGLGDQPHPIAAA
jgi:hypothetical protein